jgi:hypothetical protein
MGTPHMGTNQAAWAAPLTKLARITQGNNEVKITGSAMLADLEAKFLKMMQELKEKSKDPYLFCFWEQLPIPGIGEVSHFNSLPVRVEYLI